MNSFKLKISVLFLAFFTQGLLGQELKLSLENLKPVQELIQVAINKSPSINALEFSQDQVNEEIAMTKKKWMQHLSFAAGVNYGNGVVADQLFSDQADQRLTYLNRQNVTYSVGLNLRIPFTEATSRKHELKIKSLEIEKMDEQKVSEADLLRKEIIKLYSTLKHYISAIEIQAKVVESNALALQVAEGYFKSGKLPIEQYKTAVESNYSAQLEYEKAKNEAWLAYNSLKSIVGQEILR